MPDIEEKLTELRKELRSNLQDALRDMKTLAWFLRWTSKLQYMWERYQAAIGTPTENVKEEEYLDAIRAAKVEAEMMDAGTSASSSSSQQNE